jgi:regulatory protein YycI of two-component signal transduction system YycFG
MPIIAGIFIFIMLIVAVFLAVWLFNKFGLGDKDKYDPKTHQSIMDAIEQRDELDEMIGATIRKKVPYKGKTYQALEDTIGLSELKRYRRG